MKGNELLDMMELIAPEYIEAAEAQPEITKVKPFIPWIKWAAAAFAVVISVAALAVIFTRPSATSTDNYSHNIYDPETERRSQPLDETLIEKLVEMGVDKETASKMTVGEYEDYMSSIQTQPEQSDSIGSSSGGSSEQTNQGAEDNAGHTGEKLYTAAQLEKINALGLTLDDVKTLNDMGFTVEDIVGMTKEKAGHLLITNAAEWDCCLTFSCSGYDYHKPAENVSADFAGTDWNWAFDGISAYLEENGKPVTGLINDGIKYKLVIKLKLDHKLDKYYGFSYVHKNQVKLNTKNQSSLSAKEFYSDGEYLIAKFELGKISLTYSALDFHIEGFSLGANTKDVIVTSDDDSVEILKSFIGFCYKENPDDKEYKVFRGEFKSGVQYGLLIGYVVPEGYVVNNHPTVTLYGADDKPVVADNAALCVGFVSDGRDMYLTAFHNMPILSEESDELAGDIDGDGKVTVSDAL